jgi:hypothetical protein
VRWHRRPSRRTATRTSRAQEDPLEMKSLSSLRTRLDRVRRTLADFPMALERWKQEYASIKTQYDEQIARWYDFINGWRPKVEAISIAIREHADENYKRRSWLARTFGGYSWFERAIGIEEAQREETLRKNFSLRETFSLSPRWNRPLLPFVEPNFFNACLLSVATLNGQWVEKYQRMHQCVSSMWWNKLQSEWKKWQAENRIEDDNKLISELRTSPAFRLPPD